MSTSKQKTDVENETNMATLIITYCNHLSIILHAFTFLVKSAFSISSASKKNKI